MLNFCGYFYLSKNKTKVLFQFFCLLFVLSSCPIQGTENNPERTEDIKVTVRIPVYNDADKVGKAVESILTQTHRNLEIFVVDDHSSEPVFERLTKEFAALNDPRLHLIRLNKNVGTFGVKNFVLKQFATGEFITSQDSDDYSHSQRIQRQLEHALKHKLDGVGIVIQRIGLDGTIKNVYTGYPEKKEPSITLPLSDDRYTSQFVPSDDKPIYRTEYAARLGGHNGNLRVHGNTDFDGRFARVFPTGAYNEMPLYYWLRRENSLTTSRKTGFSDKKWWLGGYRIPSYVRLKALLNMHSSKARANLYAHLGLGVPFLGEIISDLYYPEGLEVEKYVGPGLPEGRFHLLDPKGESNRQWWEKRIGPKGVTPISGPLTNFISDCKGLLNSLSSR